MNIQQIIKKNLLAIIALVTVIGFSSFKMVENNESADDLVWFEANAAGDIGTYIGTFPEPGGNCTEPTPPTPRCAVGMDESDVDNSGPTPSSPIDNISEDPSLIQAQRHQKL